MRRRRRPVRPAGVPGLAVFLAAVLLVAVPAAAGDGSTQAGESTREGTSGVVSPAEAAPAGAPLSATVERQGVRLEATVEPLAEDADALVEGERARVRLRFTDAHTGQPMPGLYPGGWLDLLPPEDGPSILERGDETCVDRVRAFLGGTLLAQPELDLNSYYVLGLNDDASITVVDPLFGFGNSRLLDLVELRGPGGDWTLGPDDQRLFVSLPDHDRVAVVETSTWDVVLEIPTGDRPVRTVLQPDGAFAWIAHGGAQPGLTVIDARSLQVRGRLPLAAGPHDLAFSDDSRWAFVTQRGAGTVAVVDVARLETARQVDTGEEPVSVAWSSRAEAAYVLDAAGAVYAVDPEHGEARTRIPIGPGGTEIRFAPGDRLAFVPRPGADELHILDAATQRVVQTGDMEDGPDHVAFSDELAFVRHRGSDIILMIPLDLVGQEGTPVPTIDFPGGRNPAGETPRPTPAAGIVQAPGASAVLLANPADRAIYYYKEGMAAPMGHFRNYGRSPRAVEVLDNSLRERGPGVYETVVRLRGAGEYELALFLETPRMVECFPLTVQAERREHERDVLRVELLTPHHRVGVGEEVTVRYRLTGADGTPRTGVRDATALAFPSPGLVQDRHPLHELEGGLYELRFAPDEAGVWMVFLEVPSEGLSVRESPRLVLRAAGESASNGTAGGS